MRRHLPLRGDGVRGKNAIVSGGRTEEAAKVGCEGKRKDLVQELSPEKGRGSPKGGIDGLNQSFLGLHLKSLEKFL